MGFSGGIVRAKTTHCPPLYRGDGGCNEKRRDNVAPAFHWEL